MIASVMMCASAVLLLIGMLAGVVMGMQQDFTLAPAHAHLNLVGGVLLFMFGLYKAMKQDYEALHGQVPSSALAPAA